jgi:predicted deacylase
MKRPQGGVAWHCETVHRDGQALSFRWCEARGARPGPVVAVIAGQHGMEPTGPAMVAAWLKDMDVSQLRGTVRAAPLANVEALRCGFECEIPPGKLKRARAAGMGFGGCPMRLNRQSCGRNLNRLWPGKAEGTIHERLVDALRRRVVGDAQYVIDFHCWSDSGPAGVIGYSDAAIEFGRHFGLPHLHRYPLTDHPGLLGLWAMREGKRAITAELTPQNRVFADNAEAGRRGLENLLRHLRMLPGREMELPEQYVLEFKKRDCRPMKLPWDALVLPVVTPGGWHRKGDLLGRAVKLDDPRTVRDLRAPCDGLLMAVPHWAMVAAGKSAMTFYRARLLPPIMA